ncbi:DUF397 domain-containing protein [Actinocorallia sp. B10E7]|uniref:DUF397 domain-containing protein n=1 Tax=Actinocorallia sp. B10E7 TaxID=3153558 RepID=UPI00325F1F1D
MNQHTPPVVQWRKSSYSTNTGGQCVELAALPGKIGVRDSKNPRVPHLSLNPSAFRAFVGRLRSEQ